MRLLPGLCSITFRALDADEVIALAVRAGAEAVEWGSDVHAPADAPAAAAALGRRSVDAGLTVVSYGTYLGAGPWHRDSDVEWERTFDAAQALGAPMVRVWAELGITPGASAADRDRVSAQTAAIVDAAAEHGLMVALEFHPGTLTETAASANALLDAVDRPNLRTHWQPNPVQTPLESLAELRAVSPRLAHLHAFTWGPGGIDDRRSLANGAGLWPEALTVAQTASPLPDAPRAVLCEYVKDDDPEQFVADVAVLRRWLDR